MKKFNPRSCHRGDNWETDQSQQKLPWNYQGTVSRSRVETIRKNIDSHMRKEIYPSHCESVQDLLNKIDRHLHNRSQQLHSWNVSKNGRFFTPREIHKTGRNPPAKGCKNGKMRGIE